MELVYELPEQSRFKTKAPKPFGRGGQWPHWQVMLKTLTNETILHRAGLYAGGDNEYPFETYIDPIESAEHQEQQIADAEAIIAAAATFEDQVSYD